MTRLTRRALLEESLLAMAATATMPVARVLGEEKSSQSPNERLSVAVIGVRGRGGDHIRAFAARPDCQVTYVCDVDREIGPRVAAKASTAGKPVKFVEDMREIFDDKSVDIVSVATPNHWHSLAAIWAMQAGKDVYVEKPVSHNVSEGRRMIQVSRKYNRICQGGTQHRSAGHNREAARYVKEGKLGEIKLARTAMYRPRRTIGPAGQYEAPASVNYNLWAGPAPMAPITRKSFHYDWHWLWDYGNGELGNNSIHAIDLLRLILDLKGLGRGVLCYGGRQFDDAGQTPSTQVVIHDFAPITVVNEVRNLKTDGPWLGGAVLIVGTEGYIASGFTSCSLYDPKGKLVRKFSEPGQDHFDNFLKAVRSRKREDQNADIVEGHTSTALCHLGNISYRLGQPASPAEITKQLETLKVNDNVRETFAQTQEHLKQNNVDIAKQRLHLGPWLTVNSDQEAFIDNAQANALLTREYRKPFVVPAADAI
jgi:predicted dehydrogenase